MSDEEHVRLHARLYAGKDDDLIDWLNSLSHGRKSDAVKAALRRGLDLTDDSHAEEGSEDTAPAGETVAGLDRQALVEIRKIVETAVESAFQQYGVEGVEVMPPDEPPAADSDNDDEADEILSMLDAGVTLD